ETLTVTGGASLSFGDDRVHLMQPGSLTVRQYSSLLVGEFSASTQTVVSQSVYDGTITHSRLSQSIDSLVIQGGERVFDSLSLSNLTLQGGASLSVDNLLVADLNLEADTALTAGS
ncbi:MAG: hypothetical protein F6K10_16775, partial [Moorea sp. SIO2B7]|nr:hypothetical protein [Moorena sp. SIO2B7]